MKTPRISLFFIFLILIVIFTITPFANASVLNITVTTNKQVYYLEEDVEIYGNLTLDGSLVENAFVALEVDGPDGEPLVVRTLQIGSYPTVWYVHIVKVFPCDMMGNPKSSFSKGALAYFYIEVRNHHPTLPMDVTITVNVHGEGNVPLPPVIPIYILPLDPDTSYALIISFPIPSWAPSGTAKVYANPYTDWPRNGGTAYSFEKSATFTITGSSSSLKTLTTTINGNYNSTFKIPKEEPGPGTYTVYVSSEYQGQQATNNTTFEVTVPGDVDGDGVVFTVDLLFFAQAWASEDGDPNWDPRCDFDNDGIVFTTDLLIFANYWGYGL